MSEDNRSWFLNQKGKATGPFKFADLKAMASQGKLKGHDLVFREGSNEWKRAYDWPELISDVFAEEDRSSLSRLIRLPEEEKPAAVATSAGKSDQWVLLVREDGDKEVRFRQKGPYSTDEIKKLVLEEKIKASDHIWKKGAPKWVPLYDIPDFQVKNLKLNDEAKKTLEAVEEVPPYPVVEESKPPKKPVEPAAVFGDGGASQVDEITDPFINIEEIDRKEKTRAPVAVPAEPLVKPLSVAPPATESFQLRDSGSAPKARPLIPEIKIPAMPEVKPPVEPEPMVVKPVTVIAPAAEQPPPVPVRPQIPVTHLLHQETSSPDDKTVIAAGIPAAPDMRKDLQQEETRIMHVPVQQPSTAIASPSPKPGKEAPPKRIPNEDFDDEFTETNFRPPPADRSLWARMAPVAAVILLVIFGLGIWATFRTRSPFPGAESTASKEIPVQERSEKPLDEAFNSEYDPTDSLKKMKPRLPKIEEAHKAPAPAPPPPQVQVQAPPPPTPQVRDRSELDNQSPGLRFNSQTQMLEIGGGFKKGEILRVRIEGKTGQILELPALLNRLEVVSQRDGFHKISITSLKLPRGDYHVSAHFGSTRLTRVLSWGKDGNSYGEMIANHRKMIVLDQQQERKRLIRAIRDFAALMSKAESQANDANGLRKIARDLESKTPTEVRSARKTRHELIFPEMWERLAQQWERTQNMLREGGRNPASSAELAKAKREVAPMESEIRNRSMWE